MPAPWENHFLTRKRHTESVPRLFMTDKQNVLFGPSAAETACQSILNNPFHPFPRSAKREKWRLVYRLLKW